MGGQAWKLRVGFNAKERALITDHKNGDVEFKLRMGLGAPRVKTFARTGRSCSGAIVCARS